ncbi:MAG: hypothetical protein V8S84_00810 [Lachnospiraceae bacterium]
MNNPKADAALNLSLSLPESLHEKSTSLSAVLTGSVWEILVLASQDLSFLTKQYPQIEVSMLLENFALLRLPPSLIPTVSALPQILYIEMPHYISFEILSGKTLILYYTGNTTATFTDGKWSFSWFCGFRH